MATNNVDAAIAKATQAAKEKENAPAQTSTAANQVDLYQRKDNAVAEYVAPGKLKSLDDLGAAGLNVDHFLKVNEHGLEIKGLNGLIDKIKVSIEVPKMQAFDCIKFGNPAIYFKTFDGVTSSTGGSWQQSIAKAQNADPTARPYQGADIPMMLIEDALDTKGNVVAKAGVTLGHSTSTTNKANLKSFVDEVTKENLRDATVDVEITAERKTNKAGNVWGVLVFTLLGEHAE